MEVKLEGNNSVKCLKLAIQDEQDISAFTQKVLLVSKSGDDNAAGASGGAKQEPLKDDELLVSDSSTSWLCVLLF